MKVILLKDVAKIGRRFSVVTVPDGFALNKLIPKGFAEAATAEGLKRLEHVSAKHAQDKEAEHSTFLEALSTLKGTEVEVVVDANAEGKMFQALKAEVIAETLKTVSNFAWTSDHVIVKVPIKTLGEHEIELSLGDHHGTVTLNLVSKK